MRKLIPSLGSIPVLVGLLLLVVGCATGVGAAGLAHPAPAPYSPQTREFTITAVPLAVHEQQDQLDYLKDDFAKGGLLDGKEVYGFSPSSITVYAGDTVNLSLVNPEDDAHTFTINGLNVNVEMKGQATTSVSFVASKPGIYQFVCAEAEHAPYMWGQIIVLPNPAQ